MSVPVRETGLSPEQAQCIQAIRRLIPTKFILVGGAAIIWRGHVRTTSDVDILVSHANILNQLKSADGFRVVNGKLMYGSITVDILTTVDNTISFEDAKPHVEYINDIPLLKLDFALGVKLKCAFLRAEDGNGLQKRKSDLQDAVFLASKMQEANLQISETCASIFKLSFYHIIFIRQSIGQIEFARLLAVGLRKLLLPWEENSPDSQEFYLCLVESEDSDPFTVELSSDENSVSEDTTESF